MKQTFSIIMMAGMLSLSSACSAAPAKIEASPQAQSTPQESAKHAQSPVHVVELFTSQGCSSCPPANRFVGTIANDEGVLALTYGVTYWDYLGWTDTFGDPKFTKRQREYRRPLGAQNVYTPQIVLNGQEHSPRYSQSEVEAVKLDTNAVQSGISLVDGIMQIKGGAPAGSVLAFVSYRPGMHNVEVKRGENGGRTLALTNVVTDVVKIPWTGEAIKTDMKPENGMAYAALFHDKSDASIISAATFTP